MTVAASQVEREQAVEVMGHDRDGEVEVDLDHHGGGEAVEMEEGELLGDGLLDEPASRVASQDGRQGAVEVVDPQQGGAAAEPAPDRDLAELVSTIT